MSTPDLPGDVLDRAQMDPVSPMKLRVEPVEVGRGSVVPWSRAGSVVMKTHLDLVPVGLVHPLQGERHVGQDG